MRRRRVMPGTLQDEVLAVLREAGMPLRPAEIQRRLPHHSSLQRISDELRALTELEVPAVRRGSLKTYADAGLWPVCEARPVSQAAEVLLAEAQLVRAWTQARAEAMRRDPQTQDWSVSIPVPGIWPGFPDAPCGSYQGSEIAGVHVIAALACSGAVACNGGRPDWAVYSRSGLAAAQLLDWQRQRRRYPGFIFGDHQLGELATALRQLRLGLGAPAFSRLLDNIRAAAPDLLGRVDQDSGPKV